jgi:hypothetical protein
MRGGVGFQIGSKINGLENEEYRTITIKEQTNFVLCPGDSSKGSANFGRFSNYPYGLGEPLTENSIKKDYNKAVAQDGNSL